MYIYLVRHGQTEWNIQRKTQGQTDVDLNEIGKKQSNQLTDFLATLPIESVLSSDLLRCKYTAEQFKKKANIPIEYTPLLRERSYGDWEGKNADEFLEFIFKNSVDKSGQYNPYYTPPTVESLKELWERCEKMYDKIRNTDKNTLIITHGGTKSMLLSLFLKGNPYSSHSYSFQNTALTELMKYSHPHFPEMHNEEHKVFRLLRYNCTNHIL